jgi:DNA polymerase-1
VTADEDALQVLGNKEPMLRPLIRRINEYRSLRSFRSTFVDASLDIDGRMRCSFNPGGTETFRASTGTNAFWTGMNMQNIPKGDEEPDDPNTLQLPNVRKLFIPDPGYVIADMDLDRADLQVVVWEADDEELRDALRAGIDLHSFNAKTLFNLSAPVNTIKKLHPDKRDLAKRWVHGTNYGGGARTMAQSCGITVHEADRLRGRWFAAHPGIAAWHERTEAALRSTRSVANKFGYRRFYFDRVDGLLPEALAWVPQSTVAAVINRVWAEIVTSLPHVQVLNQVHDSLVMQWPASMPQLAQACLDCARRVVVPYDKPLVIPAGINVSEKSWGDCK